MNGSRFTFGRVRRGVATPLLLAVLLSLALAVGAAAQSGGGYDLSWSTVDGGGHTWSTGGGYSLGGTVGQADAQPQMAGGSYALQGGFWSPPGHLVHAPIVRKP